MTMTTALLIIDVQEAMFTYEAKLDAHSTLPNVRFSGGEIVGHHNAVLGGRFAFLKPEHEVGFR
ncbi:hypothetical protein D3C81_2270920 [compost metagenome]